MKQLFSKSRKKLTFDETQEVITPFAFKLDTNLFGDAIASPYKRAIAIAVDMLIIAMLSSAGGELLAIALAIFLFRSTGKTSGKPQLKANGKVRGRKRRLFFRITGTFIFLVVLLQTLAPMVNKMLLEDTSNQNNPVPGINDELTIEKELSVEQSLQIAAITIKILSELKEKNCQDLPCYSVVFQEIPKQAIALDITNEQAQKLFAQISQEVPLDAAEQEQLKQSLQAEYQTLITSKQEKRLNESRLNDESTNDKNLSKTAAELAQLSSPQPPVNAEPKVDASKAESLTEPEQANEAKGPSSKPTEDRPVYSFLQYIKGIIDDLGLSFGWAALYFTAFTARWGGQTPGKRLMNIRVKQLDGTPLSVWDSFGRYGGYGAGFATGLLGFMQVFWDPNRQAIHDKISATVVTDDKKVVDAQIIALARKRIEEFNDKHHPIVENGQSDCSSVIEH